MRRTSQLDHLVRDALEQGLLGPRRVVLGQVADGIEQARAVIVVEVLRRQALGHPRQTLIDVAAELGLQALRAVLVDAQERILRLVSG